MDKCICCKKDLYRGDAIQCGGDLYCRICAYDHFAALNQRIADLEFENARLRNLAEKMSEPPKARSVWVGLSYLGGGQSRWLVTDTPETMSNNWEKGWPVRINFIDIPSEAAKAHHHADAKLAKENP